MIIDLFSSFDPATNSIFNVASPLFWTLNFIILIIVSPRFWTNPSRSFWILSIPIDIIYDQVLRTSSKHLKGIASILTPLFIIIILINLLGIVPYTFRTTSHLLFTLTLGLPLWLRIVISGASFSPSYAAASLLPGGAPSLLNPFLVLIETTRIIIRPITLSFRLTANISAGHIVLALIRTYLAAAIYNSALSLAITLFFLQVGYTLFEFAICLIQAYIFCLLLSLYSDDHPARDSH